jgi:hypothetical protein
MKLGLILMSVLAFAASPAQAAGELISPRPHCASIINTTDSSLYGVMRTDYGTLPSGEKRRHESTFRLNPGEKREACASGPFYPGYKIELAIKTMFPVFTCKTRLTGTIEIKSERTKDGLNRFYATCVN